ncbi:DNA alkylation repair protein [Candidatus Nitrososphaera sp. FF02]|uniref:DNA alkylation repair protein n=1 Tax=Candidatus Nitrososphaera sp. FF02 TaxID=3398226 RepID=UPI0039EC1703
MLEALRKEMRTLADPARARVMQGFFKTGPGQYGQGDVFVGIAVPQSRTLAKKFAQLPLADVKQLLQSEVHEERLVALLILIGKYRGDPEKIAKFYLDNLGRVNNWDLVDVSAPGILGAHLLDRDRAMLYRLARSKVLWERRVAIISTLAFIRKGEFADTLKIAEMLLSDRHDLMHKAVGWMLREVGKRDLATEEEFLQRHCRSMPKTALRYAIERLPEQKRRAYMQA